MKINKYLYEINDILSLNKSATVEFINWLGNQSKIIIKPVYESKNSKKSTIKSYEIKIDNTKKIFSGKNATDTIKKVKELLIKEWFKDKKQKIKDNEVEDINLELNLDDKPITKEKKYFNNIKKANSKLEKRKQVIKKIQKKFKTTNDWYDNIWDLIYKINFKYILQNDKEKNSEEILLLQSLSWQSLAGSTDYKDHSNDTLKQLKTLTEKSINSKDLGSSKNIQMLHFINLEKEDFYDTIVLSWFYWGWNAKFLK